MASKVKKRRVQAQRQHEPASPPRPVAAPRSRGPKTRGRRPGLAESPRRLYAYALGAAVVVGALLIGLSQLSVQREQTGATSSGADVTGIAPTGAMLKGIPQHGNVLGSKSAPVQLVEYADVQCPYCGVFARDVLPTLVRDYVRTGKVQIVFRGLAFLGPDSITALRTATAAGDENRMWNVLELLYRHQGAENAWLSDELLRSIVTASGATTDDVLAARDGGAVTAALEGWARQAQTDAVTGVPAFFYGPRGGALEPLPVSQLTVDDFRTALDGALGS